jgi:hypothetical protein
MVSDPLTSIALALLSASPASSRATRADLRQDARQLVPLLDAREICPACWRLASNGTRGNRQHEPETLCVWG